VWPDSRSNRRARAGGWAERRKAVRRSNADGDSHLGAADPGRRAAIAADRRGRRGHGRGVACLACADRILFTVLEIQFQITVYMNIVAVDLRLHG
jgi:hypothetical protein